MNLAKAFCDHFRHQESHTHDFDLYEVQKGFYLGYDEAQNIAVVCKANSPVRPPLLQKTKMLSVECNVKVSYYVDDACYDDTVHIVRCFAQSKREKDIFIDLSPLFLEACSHRDQEEAILEVVATLSSFFASSNEPSDNELQGLYAELFTIDSYRDRENLGIYWQSKDRMKFDFSISESVKLEIKSTQKGQRIHHFRHEQLVSELHNTYVVSYILRQDDEGYSLFDLIENVKPLLLGDPKKLMRIYRLVKNVSEQRLKALRFSKAYSEKYRNIYRAIDIPQFCGGTPVGVSNAEYDCDLTGATPIHEETMWQEIAAVIHTEEG